MERKDLYDTIKKIMLMKFDFLIKKGYEIIQIDYTNGPISLKDKAENLSITLRNIKYRREIKLYYVPFQSETNIVLHNFSITIWDIKNMEHIEISNFMKIKHKEEFVQLSLRSFEGTLEEKLDKLLDYIANILQKYLMEVLEGGKWIRVPMDWGGAK